MTLRGKLHKIPLLAPISTSLSWISCDTSLQTSTSKTSQHCWKWAKFIVCFKDQQFHLPVWFGNTDFWKSAPWLAQAHFQQQYKSPRDIRPPCTSRWNSPSMFKRDEHETNVYFHETKTHDSILGIVETLWLQIQLTTQRVESWTTENQTSRMLWRQNEKMAVYKPGSILFRHSNC